MRNRGHGFQMVMKAPQERPRIAAIEAENRHVAVKIWRLSWV